MMQETTVNTQTIADVDKLGYFVTNKTIEQVNELVKAYLTESAKSYPHINAEQLAEWVGATIFEAGRMQGIREERARRSKG